ncbi:hypothetical protein predicted by Glimmer/Critica [Sorangium cellulosum So ce56]|uniref:Secreted protein n=1 Tax=Sorangium cellulosum (strain So ce56) TaxID=448385 RepID=A9EQ82_SORC5|nr:hypothetical protein [Sorangium cellulosum]CAN94106.1 hypothetical protein predicted by Glimmer/Critica [Sorangium cellulosum So ce56]
MPVRNLLSRSLPIAALAVPLLASFTLASFTSRSALPCPVAGAPAEPTELGAAIERQPICVGSTVASAGELGDVLYYRSSVGEDGEVSVGYYAFFSEERPWGNNWLTWTVLPALAVDLVYTHALLFAPGVQRAVYGKGDVEGFRIVYSVGEGGRLTAERGAADRGDHGEVQLERSDLLSIDPERPTVYSRWWSHQLGGRGAGPGDLAYRRCFGAGAIRPLPPDVALDFRLDRRAAPARVVPAAALLGQLSASRRGEPVDGGSAQGLVVRRPIVAL